MHNAPNNSNLLASVARRKTAKKAIYLLDVIFISKGKVEVWYQLFNQQYQTFIKLSELSLFATHEATGDIKSKNVKAYILQDIYELTERYLIANNTGQLHN